MMDKRIFAVGGIFILNISLTCCGSINRDPAPIRAGGVVAFSSEVPDSINDQPSSQPEGGVSADHSAIAPELKLQTPQEILNECAARFEELNKAEMNLFESGVRISQKIEWEDEQHVKIMVLIDLMYLKRYLEKHSNIGKIISESAKYVLLAQSFLDDYGEKLINPGQKDSAYTLVVVYSVAFRIQALKTLIAKLMNNPEELLNVPDSNGGNHGVVRPSRI